MYDESRRKLLASGGSLLAVGLLASLGARATEHEGHEGHAHPAKGMPAFAVDAARQEICATCRFWGGIRRASEDKKTVYVESLGWCSNPESHHYQAMTTPETGPMKSWKKWEAL